jgi:phasin
MSRLQDVTSTRLPTCRAHRTVTAITIRQSRDDHCTRETPASTKPPPPGLFLFRTFDLIQNSYLTAVKGVQDYNNKFFEFAHENTNAAFDFIQKMSGVRSPSAFVELSTEHARKQLESLTEQAKELATLAQKATLATAEPLKTASKPLVR